jgi:hypothetical protein
MIDRRARDELAQSLRLLVSGAMTNDDFDDRYYKDWLPSRDAAVSELSRFGWCLYSSDLLWPYKLRGRHAVSAADLQIVNRGLLFLATDLEYQWPTNVEGVEPYWTLWGPGCYLVLGLILLFSATGSALPGGLVPGILGLLCTYMTVHWLATHRQRSEEMERFFASGDYSIWPFLRREDFLGATVNVKSCKLLSMDEV